MAGLHVANVSLDSGEEWLVRNALFTYREACAKTAASEALAAVQNAHEDPEYAKACENLADVWRETIKRIDALVEKLG